jgi:hypothetical protein
VLTTLMERWLHHEDDVRGIAGHAPRIVRAGSATLLTAPHAVLHRRGTQPKRADMWTGGLALLLAELTGASALVETSGSGDASWDARHPFKDAAASLSPRIVLDLHAMRSDRQVVEVGSGEPHGRTPTLLARRARTALGGSGIDAEVDQRFPARGAATLVQWARSSGLAAVQLELSVRLVPPFVDDDTAQRLVQALCRLISDSRDL